MKKQQQKKSAQMANDQVLMVTFIGGQVRASHDISHIPCTLSSHDVSLGIWRCIHSLAQQLMKESTKILELRGHTSGEWIAIDDGKNAIFSMDKSVRISSF